MSNSRNVADVKSKVLEFLSNIFRRHPWHHHTFLEEKFKIQYSNDNIQGEAQRIENF